MARSARLVDLVVTGLGRCDEDQCVIVCGQRQVKHGDEEAGRMGEDLVEEAKAEGAGTKRRRDRRRSRRRRRRSRRR